MFYRFQWGQSMHKHLTEFGLWLQVLGVVPPTVISLLPERAIFNQELGVTVAEKFVPSRRDRIAILSGFALVALGAIFQILGG